MRTCSLLLVGITLLGSEACEKAPPPEPRAAPAPPAPAVAPPPRPAPAPAPQPAPPATARTAARAGAEQDAEESARGSGAAARAASPDGEEEAEGVVLRVRKLLGGRTTFSSAGVTRSRGPASYEVIVGLPDGTRFSFLPLSNVLTKGSKVAVRYRIMGGEKTRPVLPTAMAADTGTIRAEGLPALKPSPVGDGSFSITFPSSPSESKTDLGTLYRYEYRFSKSYSPDRYFFFRTGAEGNGGAKFFKDQAASMLALTGGKRIEVRMGGATTDKKTRLKRATGRFSLEISYIPSDGVIQLWYDAKKKMVYGAWVLAYSPNQLIASEEMWREFLGSFSVK